MQYQTTTPAAAKKSGFVSITRGFANNEQPLLKSALSLLKNLPHLLVQTPDGIEIWRKRSEVNLIKPDEA